MGADDYGMYYTATEMRVKRWIADADYAIPETSLIVTIVLSVRWEYFIHLRAQRVNLDWNTYQMCPVGNV